MKTSIRVCLKVLLGLNLVLTLAGCGQGNQNDNLNVPGENSTQQPPAPTGDFNLTCDKQAQRQYKQAGYQQKESCVARNAGKKLQSFQFKDSKISDFDLSLDCANRIVVAQSKTALDQQTAISIAADGSVKGNLIYDQEVSNDGYGADPCTVQLAVAFDGRAKCEGTNGRGALVLNTEVNFIKNTEGEPETGSRVLASVSELPGDRDRDRDDRDRHRDDDHDRNRWPGPIPVPVPVPAPAPLPVPGQGPAPVPGPIPGPAPAPGPVPFPGQVPYPAPQPVPGSPPKRSCAIQDPCPMVTKTEMNCPD
ncbi:MAG: hypothetical protein HY074_09910 [Deltaproteobacteria bacterium]|nr:hypothetical protein [Deltaproteobacteria bacterium]